MEASPQDSKRQPVEPPNKKRKLHANFDGPAQYIRIPTDKVDQARVQVLLQEMRKNWGFTDEEMIDILPSDKIRIKQSESEKQENKREYRKKYRSRPENVKKRKEKNEDPAVIAARQLYAQDPATKARKVQLAIGRQQMFKEWQQLGTANYNELRAKYIPALEKKPKKKRAPKEKKLDVVVDVLKENPKEGPAPTRNSLSFKLAAGGSRTSASDIPLRQKTRGIK